MINLLNKPLAKLAAIIVVILTCFLVYASYWAEEGAQSIEGPWLMLQDANKDLWILAEPDIYELNPQGTLIRTVDLKAMGIQGVVSDFLPLPSGEFLVAIADTQQIYEYSGSGALEHDFPIKQLGREHYNGAFKFAVAPDTGDYYVADTLEHRILIFDREGNPKGEFGRLGSDSNSFDFPNRISFGTDGMMYIADTNNHRIDVFSVTGEFVTDFSTIDNAKVNELGVAVISTPARGNVVERKNTTYSVWPTDFAFGPGSYLTVINNGQELKGGDAVIVDRAGKIITKIDLPYGTDPEYVVVRDADILITDRAGFRIIRASFNGKLLGTFGGKNIKKIFSGNMAQKTKYHLLASASRAGLIVLLIVLVIVLLMQQRSKAKADKDTLTGHFDLRPIPFKPPTKRQKAVLGTIIAGIVLLYIVLFRTILWIKQTTPHNNSLSQHLAVLIILMVMSIVCLAVFFRLMTKGYFIEKQLKRSHKLFMRYSAQMGKILRPGEKIRLYTTSVKVTSGRRTIFKRGLFLDLLNPFLGIFIGLANADMELLVCTTERLLILKISLIGVTLNQVKELSYHWIKDIKIESPGRVWGFFSRLMSIKIVTLDFLDSTQPLKWQIPAQIIADTLKAEINERKTSASLSFIGVRDLCMHCFESLLPSQETCSRCGRPVISPWKAVYLSLLYPGLGQFQKQNLFKGLAFLVFFTLALVDLVKNLIIFYRGTAEANLTILGSEIAFVVALWIGSAANAYYSSK